MASTIDIPKMAYRWIAQIDAAADFTLFGGCVGGAEPGESSPFVDVPVGAAVVGRSEGAIVGEAVGSGPIGGSKTGPSEVTMNLKSEGTSKGDWTKT